MKYCNYEKATGKILGYYDKEIHTEIPAPSIEISDATWQKAITENHNKINKDGTTLLFDYRSTEEIAYLESLPSVSELEKMDYQAKLLENLIELGVI